MKQYSHESHGYPDTPYRLSSVPIPLLVFKGHILYICIRFKSHIMKVSGKGLKKNDPRNGDIEERTVNRRYEQRRE